MTTALLLATALVLLSSAWLVSLRGRIRRSAEREQQFRAILDGAIDPIVTVDTAYRVLAFNRAAERMFGWRSPDVIGTDINRLIRGRYDAPPDESGPRSKCEAAPLQLKVGRWTLLIERRDEMQLLIDTSISESIVDGKRLYALFMKDMTEQRRIHDALKESESRYRSLLDISPVAIWLNRDNRIAFANQACLALLGADDLSQVLGKSPFQLLEEGSHDRAKARIAYLSAHSGRIAPVIEEKVVRFDGTTRDVEVAAVRLDEPDHVSILVVLLDVTQRNIAARELNESHEALRALAHSLRSIREEERCRLSEQLHEGLGQLLAAAKMRLAAFDDDPLGAQSDYAANFKLKLETLLDEILAQVRDMASQLRPPMLDQLGLAATLGWLATDVARRYGAEVITSISETSADRNTAVVLYRIARDLLERGAHESRGTAVFLGFHSADDRLVLTVRDSGIDSGHNPNRLMQQVDLVSLREQLAPLSGSVEIRSSEPGVKETVIEVPFVNAPRTRNHNA